jgi:hypothetical protein
MEQNNTYEESSQFSLCVSVQGKLQDLIEGYLDAMTAESIRAHIAVCYFCEKELNDLEQTIRLIETLPYAQTSQNFEAAIMAAIDAQSDQCFQAPVVEVETQKEVGFSRKPRTITGLTQRQLDGVVPDVFRRMRPWHRFGVAAFVFAGLICSSVSQWGRSVASGLFEMKLHSWQVGADRLSGLSPALPNSQNLADAINAYSTGISHTFSSLPAITPVVLAVDTALLLAVVAVAGSYRRRRAAAVSWS